MRFAPRHSLSARTARVLEATVSAFIRSGKPVSSLELAERGAFGVGSASIRAELNHLTHAGYLSQPHISGGRMPTDQGYEHFVGCVVESLTVDAALARDRDLVQEFLEGAWVRPTDHGRREFIRNAARRLRLLSVGYAPEHKDLYQSGLDDLFARLEVISPRELAEIARNIEELEERVRAFINRGPTRRAFSTTVPSVFIGKRSPLTTSEHLAVIADEYADASGDSFFFLAVGPKRMDYRRTLLFFRALHQIENRK